MGTYTPNYNLYKPDIGETGWGDLVNQNFDTIDAQMQNNRNDINNILNNLIPSLQADVQNNRSDIDNILNNLIPSLQTDVAYNKTLIEKLKKELLGVSLNVMMNKALLNAQTKDFYSIISDVIVAGYPYGYKSTFEVAPVGANFDNSGGGVWSREVKIPITVSPTSDDEYKIVISGDSIQIESTLGVVKTTGFGMSDFWANVNSDGSDIRVAVDNYSQIYFYIKSWDYLSQQAEIWVKIPAGSTVLYLIYSNSLAVMSDYNNPNQVFVLYRDPSNFDVNEIVPIGGSGTLSVTIDASGYIHMKALNAGVGWKFNLPDFSFRGLGIHAIAKMVSGATGDSTFGVIGFYRHDTGVGYSVGHRNINYPEHPNMIIMKDWNGIVGSGSINNPGANWFAVDIVFHDDNNIEMTLNDVTISGVDSTYTLNPLGGGLVKNYEIAFQEIRVYSLSDTATFGTPIVEPLTTTGDYITVTFDFPDGIDKLLITVDSDATAVYYSTDDGQTWNAITPDTETLLPSTAYSVKWKFENASWMNGYAFITW